MAEPGLTDRKRAQIQKSYAVNCAYHLLFLLFIYLFSDEI